MHSSRSGHSLGGHPAFVRWLDSPSPFKGQPLIGLAALVLLLFTILPAMGQREGVPPGWKAHPPVHGVPHSPAKAKVTLQPSSTLSPSASTALSPPFAPAAIRGAYGVGALSLPNPTGAGVTIAIVDAYGDRDSNNNDIIQNDLQTFCNNYGLPYNGPSSSQPTLTEAFPNGVPTSPGNWGLETALDVEWVHAMAPDAKILLVISPDNGGSMFSAVSYANANASVVSMSWTFGEWSGETGEDTTYFSTAGVKYFAATGDAGAQANYPATSPNVTAVGGTALSVDTNDNWLSETGWSGSGGGISAYESLPAYQDPWVTSGNREVPDIAADAQVSTGVSVFVNGGWWEVGGTSLATPLWAAVAGIIDANMMTPMSEPTLHNMLYTVGNSTNLNTYYHDILSGSNGTYSCQTGYDLVTGIGSPKVNILLPAVVPVAPTTITTAMGANQVTLNWSGASAATSFNIYRSTTPGGESTSQPLTTGLTGSTYTDTTVTSGTTYYYKIVALNQYGMSVFSREVSVPSGPSATAAFVTADSATQGSWKGVYGADGYNVINDTSSNNPSYPGYATVGASGNSPYTWTSSTLDVHALSKASSGTVDRIAGSWYSHWYTNSGETFDINLTDGNVHQVAFYLLDWDSMARAEAITITDAVSGASLDSRSVSSFHNGVYYVWNLSGHVVVTVQFSAGANATVSGIFFGGGSGQTVPSVPTGLTATRGASQVTLSWTASTGGTSYNIYRGTTAGGEGTTPYVSGVSANSFTDASAATGISYYYTVVGVNAVGGSGASNEASAITTPNAPAGLTAMNGITQVSLSWSASQGATSYSLYRGTSSGGESAIPIASGLTGTSYNDTGLTAGTTYYYYVTAVNSVGASVASNEVNAVPVAPTILPNGVYQLSALCAPGLQLDAAGYGTANGTNVDIWQPGGGSNQKWTFTNMGGGWYKIQPSYSTTLSLDVNGVGTTNGTNVDLWPDNGQTNQRWAVGTLSNGYWLAPENAATMALNVSGAGTTNGTNVQIWQFSSTDSASIWAIQSAVAPTAPTNLTAAAGNGQVSLSWTVSSGATSYSVYRGTTAGGEAATPIATGVTSATYTDTGLSNATTYYYEVTAVNTAGESGKSNEASATPQPPAPAAPTNLAATAGSSQVSLSWTASSGATSYNVYRGTTAGGESATPVTTGLTGTSYTDTAVTKGTTYYYTVKALNGGGSSGASNEASATPQPPPPAAPTNLTATAGSGQVSLSWTASTGATSYSVYRGTTAGGESATPVATGITSTSYTNTGLLNGTKYYFIVKAINGGGTSAASNEASSTPVLANGTYQLTPACATGARLDASGFGTTNGAAVIIWSSNGGSNQKWTFTNMGNGWFKIQPSYSTTLSLEVHGAGTTNGSTVDLWADVGQTNERWSVTAITGGYELQPENAVGQTLNVNGNGSANGTKVQLWQWLNQSGSIWTIQ